MLEACVTQCGLQCGPHRNQNQNQKPRAEMQSLDPQASLRRDPLRSRDFVANGVMASRLFTRGKRL